MIKSTVDPFYLWSQLSQLMFPFFGFNHFNPHGHDGLVHVRKLPLARWHSTCWGTKPGCTTGPGGWPQRRPVRVSCVVTGRSWWWWPGASRKWDFKRRKLLDGDWKHGVDMLPILCYICNITCTYNYNMYIYILFGCVLFLCSGDKVFPIWPLLAWSVQACIVA